MQTNSTDSESAKREKSRHRASRRVTDVLEKWEALPDTAHVRVPVVAALYGCSVPTVWRRINGNKIPKPYRPGLKTTVWNVGELRAHLRTLPHEASAPHARFRRVAA